MRSSPRQPAAILVVDANILIAALLGRSGPALVAAGRRRALATTDRAADEARGVIAGRPGLPPGLTERLDALLAAVRIVPAEMWRPFAAETAAVLGAPDHADAHLLALAWLLDADLWSHDRDFFGVGWACWTSRTLRLALAEEGGEAGEE